MKFVYVLIDSWNSELFENRSYASRSAAEKRLAALRVKFGSVQAYVQKVPVFKTHRKREG